MPKSKLKYSTTEPEKDRLNQREKEKSKKEVERKEKWTKPIIHETDVFMYCMKEG